MSEMSETRRIGAESESGAKATIPRQQEEAKAEERAKLEKLNPAKREKGEVAATIEAKKLRQTMIGKGMKSYGVLCLIERRNKAAKKGS